MASEYLKWKYRDVKPDEKKELSPKEKRKNWWYYNKWFVIGGIIAAVMLGSILINATGIFETKPDVQVALITQSAFSDEDLKRFEEAFEAIAGDCSNDGKVYVQINPYVQAYAADSSEETAIRYADELRIIKDIDGCESFLFITDSPEAFQNRFAVYSLPDGTVNEGTEPYENCVYAMQSIASFDGIRDLTDSLYIGRRGFWTSRTVKYYEGCLQLWQRIAAEGE